MENEITNLSDSQTIQKYKSIMRRCIKLYYPDMTEKEIDTVIDYSIQKRFKNSNANVVNSYTKKTINMNLLAVSDYIMQREPIVTAFGTMFQHHGSAPNPLASVVQSFLNNRSAHKKTMLSFPRGSEDYEKYNLLQSLN